MTDEKPKLIQTRPRLVGTILLAFSAVLGKLTVYDLVKAAREGQDRVSISHIGIAMSALFLAMSLALLIFGGQAAEVLRDRGGAPWPAARKKGVAGLVIVALGCDLAVECYLSSLSYS